MKHLLHFTVINYNFRVINFNFPSIFKYASDVFSSDVLSKYQSIQGQTRT